MRTILSAVLRTLAPTLQQLRRQVGLVGRSTTAGARTLRAPTIEAIAFRQFVEACLVRVHLARLCAARPPALGHPPARPLAGAERLHLELGQPDVEDVLRPDVEEHGCQDQG